MLHRLWNMLTDFSGNEGEENAFACLGLLIVGAIIFAAFVAWRLT